MQPDPPPPPPPHPQQTRVAGMSFQAPPPEFKLRSAVPVNFRYKIEKLNKLF